MMSKFQKIPTAPHDEENHPSFGVESENLLRYGDADGDASTEHDRLSDEQWNGKEDRYITPGERRRLVPRPSTLRGWALLVVVVALAWVLGGAVGFWYATAQKSCTVLECVKMTSAYSPLLEQVEYHDYQFHGDLSDTNVFKGHPRPELDAAWERLGRMHPLSMPEEHRVELNKTHSGILYPPEKGGGVMVEIEALHQLHCLNLMRKVIYADYYSRPENLPIEFMVSDKMFFNHIDHCVDNLRQFIMCQADMTPVPSNWVHGHHDPNPDFNTMHKCRNFNHLLDWIERHDNGGVPRQTPNPSWWPKENLAKTILDYEPDFPIPPHGPHPDFDPTRWGSD